MRSKAARLADAIVTGIMAAAAGLILMSPAHAATARNCPVPAVGTTIRPTARGTRIAVYLKSNPCGELVRAQEYCETGLFSLHYRWATGRDVKAPSPARRNVLSVTDCGSDALAALSYGFENYNGYVRHWTYHQLGTRPHVS